MPDNLFPLLAIPALFTLLHLTALILALVFHRRCPAACSLVILAAILNILVTLGRVGFQVWWVPGVRDPRLFMYTMMGMSLVSWIAYGLMIVAVFAGRNQPTPAPYRPSRPDQRDDDDWQAPAGAPALPKADATGIQEKKP